MMKRCFICNRKLGKNPRRADTHEDQWVFIGSECYQLIRDAGVEGYQASQKSGLRLYPMTIKRMRYFGSKGLL